MKYFVLFIIGLLIGTSLYAQDAAPADSSLLHKDTVARNSVQAIKTRMAIIAKEGADDYRSEQVTLRQQALHESIKSANQQARIFLKNGVDTSSIKSALQKAQDALEIVKDGIFTNTGSYQTQRNLAVSAAILTELSNRIAIHKKHLNTYSDKLTYFANKIDSLVIDSAFFYLPTDSEEVVKRMQKIVMTARELKPTDSVLRLAIANVQALQIKVDLLSFEIQARAEDIDIYSKKLSAQALDREFANIWTPPLGHRPFKDILQFSREKEWMMFRFYLEDYLPNLLLWVVLLCACFYFLRSLKAQLKHEGILNADYSNQLIVRNPLLSATLLCLCIFQFIFPNPPFIFSFMVWLGAAICLAFVFRGYITRYWMQFWIMIDILFLLAGLDNMILQASRPGRLFMLGLSVTGVLYTGFILVKGRKQELKEKYILYFISFVFLFELISAVLNTYGRLNLSKTFLISGYMGVVIAIVFLWVVRLINEGLNLISQVFKHPGKDLFYINFNKVGNRMPAIFYVLLVIGWAVLVGRNFYGFRQLSDPFNEYLRQERTLGNYTFSIMGIVVFVLILLCSMFLSQLISAFASEPVGVQQSEEKRKRVNLGSWILLIRIFIISAGLFLAFAAAGIPMDRITIIIGALGVGIGLGLQGLVNNLVSGLILSFEKPVNVGDIIEMNGKIATMKSIGFRSSIITDVDGACIIIPNGELLNHPLVNWTMGKNLKRNILILGVAYGTDLDKTKQLLRDILLQEDRVLNFPPPDVVFREFNQSSIDLEISFWVKHIGEARTLKSDIIMAISRAFANEGIVIPYPQHDLYIRSLPDEVNPQPNNTQTPS